MIATLRTPRILLVAAMIAAWVAVNLATGNLYGEALAASNDPFRSVVTAAAWSGWFLVLLALAVPRPVTLTIARFGVGVAFCGAVWAAVEVDDTATIVAGLAAAAVALFVAHLPGVGDRFVDGVSYGDEQRFLLRPPGLVLVALLLPTFAFTAVGLLAGPLLLADERWVVGVVAVTSGWPIAWLGINALHRLTRRFVVFVPNGVVLHDPTVVREPVLFVTREVAGIAPAPADTTATDLTSQAMGLALEVKLGAPVGLTRVTGRSTSEEQSVASFLISPSRPAALLATAVERGLPIA